MSLRIAPDLFSRTVKRFAGIDHYPDEGKTGDPGNSRFAKGKVPFSAVTGRVIAWRRRGEKKG
jgi:hypothetical protein